MTEPSSRIRVLCVDDHRIVRDGLALIIGREPDMEIVGAASSGEASVELFRRLQPDVTLMDLQLGSMSGVDAIRAIRSFAPASRIIVLTIYQGDEDIHRALEAGATTYLLKDMLSDDLVRVVREVHAGGHPVRPEVAGRDRARRHAIGDQACAEAVEVARVEEEAHGLRAGVDGLVALGDHQPRVAAFEERPQPPVLGGVLVAHLEPEALVERDRAVNIRDVGERDEVGDGVARDHGSVILGPAVAGRRGGG